MGVKICRFKMVDPCDGYVRPSQAVDFVWPRKLKRPELKVTHFIGIDH